MKKQILMSVMAISVTSMLMGIYADLTTPKIHIDNTSPLETTKQLVPPSHASSNPSSKQLFNDTNEQSIALENQHENNITISK